MLGIVKFSKEDSCVILCEYKNHSPVRYIHKSIPMFFKDLLEGEDILGVEVENGTASISKPCLLSFKNLSKSCLSINDDSEMNSVYGVISITDSFPMGIEKEGLEFGKRYVRYKRDFREFNSNEKVVEILKVVTKVRGSLLNDVEYIVITRGNNCFSYYEITDLDKGLLCVNRVCSTILKSISLIKPL